MSHRSNSHSAYVSALACAAWIVSACASSIEPRLPKELAPTAQLLVKISNDSQVVDWGGTLVHTVEARDSSGRLVTGVVINWSASGGGLLSASQTTTGGDGRASVTHTLSSVSGAESVNASTMGVVPAIFTTFAVGPATTIVAVTPDNVMQLAGATVTHTVEVRDAQNVPRPGIVITWKGTSGYIPPPVSTTDLAGRASWIYAVKPGADTASASASVIPGSAVTFTTVGAVAVMAGSALPNGPQQFSPASVTVKAGDVVAWEFPVFIPHNVTFTTAGAPADIPSTTIGVIYRTFDTPGTFTYECTLHQGMTGTVVVAP